jgi:predicted small metal-binding protein
MAQLIRCQCGFVARGDSEDGVIMTIRDHMREDHPALLESVATEELRGWIEFD